MQVMIKSIQLVFTLVALWLIPEVLSAAVKTDDIRIVVDVSGSMKKTDPSNLRIPALKLLNGLIPSGSRAGAWTFGRYVNMTVKWGRVNDAWRKRADVGADQIHSNGLYTNIEKALARASLGWEKKDPGTRRSIILLTDGKVDVSKDPEKNIRSRERLLAEGIQSLKQMSVKIHAVALSKDTDEALLKQLALETGGSFEIAETAQELQKVFFKMFERATEPDSVMLKGDQFSVDKSIKEMTLLIFRQPGGKNTQLYPPDSRVITARKPGKAVWRSDGGYDLITIKNPKSGIWKFEADLDPDNRLMVVTDLKLQLDALPAYLTPFEALKIGAQLYNKDKKIKKNSFLRFVEFSLTHTDSEGVENNLELVHSKDRKKKGLYQYSFEQGLEEGTHSFVVSANSRTFNRIKRVKVEVQWPVEVSIDPVGEPGNYSLLIKAREEYLKPESLVPTVQMEAPDGTRQNIELKKSGEGWLAAVETIQNGIYQASIVIEAETASGKEVQLDLGKFSMVGILREMVTGQDDTVAEVSAPIVKPTMDPEISEEEEKDDWVLIAIIVGLVNLVLIIVGLGSWYLMRRKKSEPDLSFEDSGANA